MYRLCFPRIPRYRAGALALAAVLAAVVCFSAAACAAQSASGEACNEMSPLHEELSAAENDALLARAQSLEVLGRYFWDTNLSASRARLKAFELRGVARLLLEDAKSDVDRAESHDELEIAKRRFEIIKSTSAILDNVADRLEGTRGTRRKIRILGLELSRQAWAVVRENALRPTHDQRVIPGQLFKDNPPAASPMEHALLREPKEDYLTYKMGAISTEELVQRTEGLKPRHIEQLPEQDLYYREGAITLSPLDKDPRSKRIWWSPPPEELAWKVEQW
jgi:hypothetical protein